ncbi:MAG: hypothetical protein AB1806_03235 [Acidobacteriota bacterium]
MATMVRTASRGVQAWRQVGIAGSQAGLSLLDTLVVVSVAGVMLAIAIPSVGTALTDARANAAMRAVEGHLRASRDEAMSVRRAVEVQFVDGGQLQSTQLEGTNRRVILTTALENNMRFQVTPGLPDTPDLFGQAAGIDFGGPTTVYFQPEGSLTDAAGLPVSGTVFLGAPDRLLSARAVTVLGPTGRVRGYRWDGIAWR